MAATAVCPRSKRNGEDFSHVHSGPENRSKRGRRKTVTWPIDEKICEVRSFLVDDTPSSLGAAAQEHLHCKQANALLGMEGYDVFGFHVLGPSKRSRLEQDKHVLDVPPGFGYSVTAPKSCQPKPQLDAAMAASTPWHCPPKFLIDASWLWAGGEESLEITLQQQKERRFFEAFYPRRASIPDSPMEPSEEPSKKIDDALVAQIPLVSLEEEEVENEEEIQQESKSIRNGGAVSAMSEHGKPEDACLCSDDIVHRVPMKQHQGSTMSMADSNIAAAAAAACMVVKALGESDLVDEKLLLEILRNPSLLKSLTCSNRSTKSVCQDEDNSTATCSSSSSSSRQFAPQETSIRHKLPTGYVGACLNRLSPGNHLDNPHTVSPIIADGRTPMDQSTTSIKLLPPSTSLPTTYPCRNPQSSRGLQEGAECIHVQIPEISEMRSSRAQLNEASPKHVYGPRDSQNGRRTDPYSCAMQAVMASSFPRSVRSTYPLTKNLPHRNSMQVGPPKYRAVENRSLRSQTSAYTCSAKGGGRNKRSCLYFNSSRGCRNGESCNFAHQSLASSVSTMAQ